MATWQMLVGPSTSTPTAQLTRAKARRFTFNLDAASTAAFAIDGRAAEAAQIVELGADLHLLRDAVPLYTGRIMSSADDFDDAGHSLQATSADTRGLLARRVFTADASLSGDSASVAAQLLNAAQSTPNTSLNVAVPTFPSTGTNITRQVKAGANVLAEMAAVAGGQDASGATLTGFDWDISPGWVGGPGGNPTARLWAPRRGRDLTGTGGVVLDYTYRTQGGRLVPRNSPVARVNRAFDPTAYANVYTASGGAFTAVYRYPASVAAASFETVRRGLASEGNPVLVTTTYDDNGTQVQLKDGSDAESDDTITYGVTVPTTPVSAIDGSTVWYIGAYGAYEAFSDVASQAELNRLAAARSQELRAITPTYNVTLKNNWWQGPDHIWLGDTIRLILNTGRLNEDVALRVTAIDLELGDDGQEGVTLTVGPTRRNQYSPVVELRRRMEALERS